MWLPTKTGMGNRLSSHIDRIVQAARERFSRSETKTNPGRSGLSGVWIDVGAYLGTESFPAAKANPALQVYAFEPNLKLAAQCWGLLPNYTVLAAAVSESDGFADFYVNANVGSSSLLPMNPEGVRRWIGGHLYKVEWKSPVPTVRLDTFMKWANISRVEYLKVDAQGADLSVIKSAGEKLRDIKKIKLEVAVTPVSPYVGAASRTDVVAYLEKFGFTLAGVESQFHDQEENLTFISRAAI
jgi:FkbM family methyltransferase